MKKLLFTVLMALIVMYGCSPVELTKGVIYTGLDFTKYTNKNFLFTPEQYLGEYDSIGLLNAVLYPDMKKSVYKDGSKEYELFEAGQVNTSEALDSLYSRAVRMGADAIVRLTVNSKSIKNGAMIMEGIELNGFAIKRKPVTIRNSNK